MNKLFQQLSQQGNNSLPSNMKQTINMLKSMKNPQGMIQNMLAQNPQAQQAINLAGGNPKKAFYDMAKQKGVDPNEILNMLK